jgi:hypothetical protein
VSIRRLRPGVIVAVAAGFALGSAAVVVAQTTVLRAAASTIDRVKTASGGGGPEGPSVTNGTLDIKGARHSLILTKTSLVIGRFAAPTSCSGGAGRCHVQIQVLDNNNGDAFVTQMHGLGHMDSTFVGDGHEGHATEQWITLPPGNYDFQAQMQTFNCCGSTDPVTFHIPGWTFTVERIVN